MVVTDSPSTVFRIHYVVSTQGRQDLNALSARSSKKRAWWGLDGGHSRVGWWAQWGWMVGTAGLDGGHSGVGPWAPESLSLEKESCLRLCV